MTKEHADQHAVIIRTQETQAQLSMSKSLVSSQPMCSNANSGNAEATINSVYRLLSFITTLAAPRC